MTVYAGPVDVASNDVVMKDLECWRVSMREDMFL